jgi:hypothetical protein
MSEFIGDRENNEISRRKFVPLLKDFFEIPFFIQRKKTLFLPYADSLFRPFFLLLLITLRPPGVLILSRKP